MTSGNLVESLDPLLSYTRWRMLPLHAATIICDGEAHVFVGRPASGKSTIALKALEDGMEVLGDDEAILFSGKDGLYVSAPEDIPMLDGRIAFGRVNKVKTIRGVFRVGSLNFIISMPEEQREIVNISKKDYAILLALTSRTFTMKGRQFLSKTISFLHPKFKNPKFIINPENFKIKELIEFKPGKVANLGECLVKIEKYENGFKEVIREFSPELFSKLSFKKFRKVKRDSMDVLVYDIDKNMQIIFKIINESLKKNAGPGWLIMVSFERKDAVREDAIPLHFFVHPSATKNALISAENLEGEILKAFEKAEERLPKVQSILQNLREFEEFFESIGFEVEAYGGLSEARLRDDIVVGYHPMLATNDLRMLETWFIYAPKMGLAKYYYEDRARKTWSHASFLAENGKIKLVDLETTD